MDFLHIKNIKKRVVLVVFGLKIFAGIALTMLYSHYYGDGKLTGDTAHYYNDGNVLNSVFSESPSDYFRLLLTPGDEELIESRLAKTEHWTRGELDQFNDNRFIIRINSVIAFFSWNSIYVHIVIFGFLALVGFILFYKSIVDHIPKYKTPIFLLICLFPSLLFWTSSILKESLLVFGFGLLLYGILKFKEKKGRSILLLIIGLFILINTKIYFLICLIPAIIVFAITNSFWKKSLVRIGGLAILGVIFLLVNGTSDSNNVLKFMSQKQKDFILVGKGGVYFMDSKGYYRVEYSDKNKLEILNKNEVRIIGDVDVEVKKYGEEYYSKKINFSDEGKGLYDYYGEQIPSNSFIEIPSIDNKWIRLLKYTPVYISNVLLMPYPWQKGSILKWINIVENLAFFCLFGFVLYFRKKWINMHHKSFYASLVFIFAFYLIIGATTPVLGAIVRYKTPAFLIWMMFFLSIIDLERINLKFNKNTK